MEMVKSFHKTNFMNDEAKGIFHFYLHFYILLFIQKYLLIITSMGMRG